MLLKGQAVCVLFSYLILTYIVYYILCIYIVYFLLYGVNKELYNFAIEVRYK